jgi:hypothetical protein
MTTDRAKRYHLLWWKFFKAGYPTCCISHAVHYWMVIWDIGEDCDMSIKCSVN